MPSFFVGFDYVIYGSIWVGVNIKVYKTEKPMPNVFLRPYFVIFGVVGYGVRTENCIILLVSGQS